MLQGPDASWDILIPTSTGIFFHQQNDEGPNTTSPPELRRHCCFVGKRYGPPSFGGWCWMGVSENGGTSKSSILIGFSIINHPFWGISPYFWKHPNSWWSKNGFALRILLDPPMERVWTLNLFFAGVFRVLKMTSGLWGSLGILRVRVQWSEKCAFYPLVENWWLKVGKNKNFHKLAQNDFLSNVFVARRWWGRNRLKHT